MSDEECLLWFSLADTKGRTWCVWLASELAVPELRGLTGWTVVGSLPYASGTRNIYLNVACAVSVQAFVLMHELLHAAGWDANVHCVPEEKFVRAAEKNMLKFLTGCGLRWPRRPRGYTALHRAARKRAGY